MWYRGGRVGHKYMQEIEAKHENMSIECDHWDSRPKPPPPANNTDGDTIGDNNNAPEDLEQPEDNNGGS